MVERITNDPLNYLGVRAPTPPNLVRARRNPTVNDVDHDLGTEWMNEVTGTFYKLAAVAGGVATWDPFAGGSAGVDTLTGDTGGAISPVAGNINLVGNNLYTVAGAGNTLTFTETAGAYPITPFVVGGATQAGYATIQAALDAANAAGGGSVYVQAGTYTENLTLYEDIDIVGVPGNSDAGTTGNTVVIVGVHTPPTAAGSLSVVNCRLESATHIFNSAGAGACSIILENCLIEVTNGYLFNLANWTADLVVYNLGDASTNNGVVNNTGGSTCFFISATLGNGNGQTMNTTGTVNMQEIDLRCPWNAQTGTVIDCLYVAFSQPITLSNDSAGGFFGCQWSTGATAAITMSSSGAVSILTSQITSSNNPAIDGAGAGTLTLGDLVFTSNAAVAGTLTLAHAASRLGATTITGNLTMPAAASQIQIEGGAVTDFIGQGTLTAGTVTIANTNIAATDKIFISRSSINGSTALGNFTYTINAGVSFTVTSVQPETPADTETNDVSIFEYVIIRQL